MTKKPPIPFTWPSRTVAMQRLSQIRTYFVSVGEEFFELTAALLVMITVEHHYGRRGLGIYAFLTACLFAVRYLANFGVAQHVAREVARHDGSRPKQNAVYQAGYQALACTGLAAAVAILATAFLDSSQTRIDERTGAYLIIALIIPVANLNSLKLSVLQGLGRHGLVARLRSIRYGLIVGAVFILSRIGLAPSYLLSAILAADLLLARFLRPHLAAPPLATVFTGIRRAPETLKQGQAYLLCDDGLTLLLNIDLFVLGLFVSSWDLGIYAQAAVLIRFFLIVPAGLKPVFRQRYTAVAVQGRMTDLAAMARRRTLILFSLHAFLALWVLLYFPLVLDLFFDRLDEVRQSYRVFAITVPGMIFYSALCAQEPLLEAVGQAQRLRRMTIRSAAVNLLLTFWLVPALGIAGAAAATMLTMLIYFGYFGKDLPIKLSIRKFDFAIAGLSVYLVYMLLKQWGGTAFDLWLGPILLGALFWLSGLYGTGIQPLPDAGKAS